MTRQISESDWKLFRQLHPIALGRMCESILSEVGRIAAETDKSLHERYLEVFNLLQRRDKELGEAFDGMRRSTAWRQLALLRSRGLLTAEEFDRFSADTRDAIRIWSGG